MVGGPDLAVKTFSCTQCGLCCRNVHLAEETRFLDRGNGACRHYNEAQKLCTIYSHRPDICRVDRQYELNYSKQYSWDEFVDLNLQVCHILGQTESQAL
ncbi:YkgJ family cysteine cluster protein [Kushneria sp. TE3]|uniref:YkgJ family cysteine cluster protein n=1 Tax=Kushneria sp. TE3 TaxID=3449832 RepID=UPI003F686126